jgi:ribosome biogenesis GTPase A
LFACACPGGRSRGARCSGSRRRCSGWQRRRFAGVPASAEALLVEIGRRRGALRKGGIVDLHKAAEVLVHEFRAGVIGAVSLEAPPVDTRPLAIA